MSLIMIHDYLLVAKGPIDNVAIWMIDTKTSEAVKPGKCRKLFSAMLNHKWSEYLSVIKLHSHFVNTVL